MGDVVRFPCAPQWGKAGRPSARPDVGHVRIVLDGIEHVICAEDALLLGAEICASAADAYRLEREVR
jgi:hypothetical protein